MKTTDLMVLIFLELQRVADALDRAYPPAPEKKEREPRKLKSPVVMFSSVPNQVIRPWPAKIDRELRCLAAVRPWINGMGQKGMWARCRNQKAEGDSLCGMHRRQAEEVGVKKWLEVQ